LSFDHVPGIPPQIGGADDHFTGDPRNPNLAYRLDEKYVDTVVLRWQGLTGGKATLEGEGRTFEEISEERLRVGSAAE
jgi:hypothetical protein